jgi:hypothetical protein
MRDNFQDYFRRLITVHFLGLYAKWNENKVYLPSTYTPEPFWGYSWFLLLLKRCLPSMNMNLTHILVLERQLSELTSNLFPPQLFRCCQGQIQRPFWRGGSAIEQYFQVNSLNCLSNTKIWVRFIFIDGRHLFFFLLFWKIFILWKKWPNLFFTFSFYQIFKNNIPKASWLRLFRMNWTNF